VTYEKATTVTTIKTAKVELVMLISVGSSPPLRFNEDDQRIFIESFCKELGRLKYFQSVTCDAEQSNTDIQIKVSFLQHFYNPKFQIYTLDIAMQILGGRNTFFNRYHIVSSEGDSLWEIITTDASEGKTKAAKKLINALISDVEKCLSSD